MVRCFLSGICKHSAQWTLDSSDEFTPAAENKSLAAAHSSRLFLRERERELLTAVDCSDAGNSWVMQVAARFIAAPESVGEVIAPKRWRGRYSQRENLAVWLQLETL